MRIMIIIEVSTIKLVKLWSLETWNTCSNHGDPWGSKRTWLHMLSDQRKTAQYRDYKQRQTAQFALLAWIKLLAQSTSIKAKSDKGLQPQLQTISHTSKLR